MNKKTNLTVSLMFIFILLSGVLHVAVADDDHRHMKWHENIADDDDEDEYEHKIKHRERENEHHREGNHSENHVKKVNNSTYKKECGACHFAYQPELLPSASWMRIIANLDDHFGEAVKIDDASKKVISDYVKLNSAENSSAKRAVKMMGSSGNQVPMRITDISYIRKKHHKITSDILKRKPIGSLSNCSACHTTAEDGNYDEDNVIIPHEIASGTPTGGPDFENLDKHKRK